MLDHRSAMGIVRQPVHKESGFGHIAFGHVVALGSRFDDVWYKQ